MIERVGRGGELEPREQPVSRRLREPGRGSAPRLRHEPRECLHAADAAVREIHDRLEHCLDPVAVDRSLDPVDRDASALGDPSDVKRLVLGEPLCHLTQPIDRDAGSSVGGSMDRAQDLISRLVFADVAHGARADHRCDGSRIRARRQRDDPGLR